MMPKNLEFGLKFIILFSRNSDGSVLPRVLLKWMATVLLSVCAIVKPWLIDQLDTALMASCRRLSRAGR